MNNNQLSGFSIALFFLAFFSLQLIAQERAGVAAYEGFPAASRYDNGVRVVFYNVENLFDTVNDHKTWDEEFLPDGKKQWTTERYEKKLNNTSKTLLAVGGWEAPAVIGLCEVENRRVLDALVSDTEMKKYDYQTVHYESPDKRGIDVAFLYRADKFKKIDQEAIPIRFPDEPKETTRDVLYVKGVVLGDDTVHIFVNHWPSRWYGKEVSEPKRMHVAAVLRERVDKILVNDVNAKIIVMGDLNDEPSDKSIAEVLRSKTDLNELDKTDLINLMGGDCHGTCSYKDWNILDHIIVSQGIVKSKEGLHLEIPEAQVFKAPWLMDRRYDRPYRTFYGSKYLGGYSDHLAIFIDLNLTSEEGDGFN